MTNYNFSNKITDLNIASQISKNERKKVMDRINEQRKKLWKRIKDKLEGSKSI